MKRLLTNLFFASKSASDVAGHLSYLPSIDGLRAYAVLSVLIFHLNKQWLPGGFLGVDIFFVISGYVVSRAATQIHATQIASYLVQFYARRMGRIIPPLLGCLLVTFALTTLFIPPAWMTHAIDRTGLFAYAGLSNWILGNTAGDYFSPIAEFNPFTHTWSLGIEEQFYFLFPILFYLWSLNKTVLTKVIGLVLATASLIYAAFGLTLTGALYFSTLGRIWELGLGVLLFQFQAVLKTRLQLGKRAQDGGIIALIAVAMFALYLVDPAHTPFPGALLVTLPTAGLILLMQSERKSAWSAVFENRLALYIGTRSYSLYLWHWPVFILMKWTLGLESTLCQLLALLITFAATLISYHLIEAPSRSFFRRIRPTLTVLICIGCTFIAYKISNRLIIHKDQVSQSVVVKHQQDWYPNRELAITSKANCEVIGTQESVGESIFWLYRRNPQCPIAPLSKNALFTLGDSHSLHYRAMLNEFTQNTGVSVYLYANGGCPFMSLIPSPSEKSVACQQHIKHAYADISNRLQAGDLLFLSSLQVPRQVDQWAPIMSEQQTLEYMQTPLVVNTINTEQKYYQSLLAGIHQKGVAIVFGAPSPMLGYVPFRCADWFNRHNPICENQGPINKSTFEAIRKPVMNALFTLEQRMPNTWIWDPVTTLCPGEYCETSLHGQPLYFDGDHLSGAANHLLETSFENAVSPWFLKHK